MCALVFCGSVAAAAEPAGPATSWPLAVDARSESGKAAVVAGGVRFGAPGPGQRTAAAFDGRDGVIEVVAADVPRLGTGDFTLSAWVWVDPAGDDVPGDILSQYDPKTRRGFHLTLKTNAGVTTNQANYRQLQFGIDNARESEWTDCGRPGNALLAFALCAHDGKLWAGTCEPAAGATGRVYRHEGGELWSDQGAPDHSNAVTAMAEHDGQLYVGTGKYRLGGSALTESENTTLGGRVFRHQPVGKWEDCGQLPDTEAVGGLVTFRGRLYASSLYRPAGFFRYEGNKRWTRCPTPGEKRVEAMCIYNGHLYATSYDGGRVYRYDGSVWTDCGQLGGPEENSQTYSFAIYRGRLYVGTWRSGKVYRFEDVNRWTDVGRLGEELEVMGMLVHNGRLIAGTLPLAEVYEFDGASDWRKLARLDHTPEVTYRRAWTMAEHGGRVYCSTLPSGRVYSSSAGCTVSWDRAFPAGWHHVAAVKAGPVLRLYVDGEEKAQSRIADPGKYDLASNAPLRIGCGENDFFHGRICDVRWHLRVLEPGEIAQLARE